MILFANRKYFVCPPVTEKLQQACKDSFINFYLMEKNHKIYRFSDPAIIPSSDKKQFFIFQWSFIFGKNSANFVIGLSVYIFVMLWNLR